MARRGRRSPASLLRWLGDVTTRARRAWRPRAARPSGRFGSRRIRCRPVWSWRPDMPPRRNGPRPRSSSARCKPVRRRTHACSCCWRRSWRGRGKGPEAREIRLNHPAFGGRERMSAPGALAGPLRSLLLTTMARERRVAGAHSPYARRARHCAGGCGAGVSGCRGFRRGRRENPPESRRRGRAMVRGAGKATEG